MLKNFCCSDNSYDIILLSETHIDCSVDSSEIELDGYQLFRKDRNRHGGGVLIYAKSSLQPVLFSDIDSNDLEFVFIKLLGPTTPLLFGVYYRQPNQPRPVRDQFMESLRVQLDFLTSYPNLKFFMFGDFNDRCHDWLDNHLDSELGLSLVDLSNDYNISQLILSPTRGNSLLDLLFTNSPELIHNIAVTPSFDNLDHDTLTGNVQATHTTASDVSRPVRKFSPDNLSALNSSLNLVPWHVLLNSDSSVDENLNTVYRILSDELNAAIPPFTITSRPRDQPGMTHEVRLLFKKVHSLYRIAKKNKKPS